jgi:hypothetical protein
MLTACLTTPGVLAVLMDRYPPHPRTFALAAEETGRPGESGQVAGVVNAMDGGKSAAVPLDLVNAGGAKI